MASSDRCTVPVFKKGSSSSVENYRPISLCCVTCKLMESIINESLMKFLSCNHLLKTQQFGFQKHKSCTIQLLSCVNKWSALLDSKKSVDIAYIDFQKAFDSVVHSKLLIKLQNFGIKSFLLNWISSFLSNRTQRVKIKSTISDPKSVLSGVPQGSVLGPTLFLVYINDIVDSVKNSEILLFADDLKVFNTSDKSISLQEDLDRIDSWANCWQLSISYSKSSTLYLGGKNPKNSYSLGPHILEDTGLGCKDLGIFISSNLSPSTHCSNIVSKASKIAAMINRCFTSKNPDVKIMAFKTYVRPIFEYASVVWNPYRIVDINNIENVQRRFTKKVLWRKQLSYENRLEYLKLDRLEIRRIQFDIQMAYNIIVKSILPFDDFYATPTSTTTRSATNEILYIKKFRLDCRKFEFCNRSTLLWNALPRNVKNVDNIEKLEKNLETVDLRIFLK